MATVVTFGEVMGRIAPEGFLRFKQNLPGKVDFTFGGAEANVAASIACLGGDARFVTALPKHSVADACVAQLRGLGVDTSMIKRTDKGRLGLYLLESGANQRPSSVIYDREYSSISMTEEAEYNWKAVFDGAEWFHISGITPAISKVSAEVSLAAAKAAKEAGVTVSCDLNYRKKLWKWDSFMSRQELAEKTMRGILPYVDVVIANEEDASDVLSIHPEETDINAGVIAVDKYPDVAKKIAHQFPHLTKIAITLRESYSATHNNWGAMLYDVVEAEPHFAPKKDGTYQPYEIKNIIDRVGGGDSFAAGLIYALTTTELSEPETAISFAVASSCLAHSHLGDINYASRSEVEALMGGSVSGRVQR